MSSIATLVPLRSAGRTTLGIGHHHPAAEIVGAAEADHGGGVGHLVDDDVFGRAGDDEIDALGAERLGGGGAARDGEELEAVAGRRLERRLERTPVGLELLEALDVGDGELVALGRGRKRDAAAMAAAAMVVMMRIVVPMGSSRPESPPQQRGSHPSVSWR